MKLAILLVSRKKNRKHTFVRQAPRQSTARGSGFNAIGWAGRIRRAPGTTLHLLCVYLLSPVVPNGAAVSRISAHLFFASPIGTHRRTLDARGVFVGGDAGAVLAGKVDHRIHAAQGPYVVRSLARSITITAHARPLRSDSPPRQACAAAAASAEGAVDVTRRSSFGSGGVCRSRRGVRGSGSSDCRCWVHAAHLCIAR